MRSNGALGTLVNYTAGCGGTLATGPGSPILVTGLASGAPYFCHVKTISSAGSSTWSDWSSDPGINPNCSHVNQSFNEHMDSFTGSLQQHDVDLHLPDSGGFDLPVVRPYNATSEGVTNANGNIYD